MIRGEAGMVDCESMGKLIRENRKAKGLTQFELAQILNVSDKAVSKWECGKCYPDISIWENLSNTLGFPIESLKIGEGAFQKEVRKGSSIPLKGRIVLYVLIFVGIVLMFTYVTTGLTYFIRRSTMTLIVVAYYAILFTCYYFYKKRKHSVN